MLTLTLDFAGTTAEAEQCAAEHASKYEGLSYKVAEPGSLGGNQWPTIVAHSLDHGQLLSFGSDVYNEPTSELEHLIG